MKPIENLFLIIFSLSIFGLGYLAMSFVNADFDFREWERVDRIICAIITAIMYYVLGLIIVIYSKEEKHKYTKGI